MRLPLGLAAAATLAPAALAQCELVKIHASNAASGDSAGQAVAVHGGLAVMGAEFVDGGSADEGAVYVLERTGNAWAEVAILIPLDKDFDDRFGHSATIWEERVVAGARYNADNGYGTGSAYVFDRQPDGSWLEVAKLVPSDAMMGDLSANSVGVHGDRVVVGSSGHDLPGATAAGQAYVFEDVGGVWTETAILAASDGAAFDQFGIQVAISGSTIICGARSHDSAAANGGAVYVFEPDGGGGYQEVAKLVAPDAEDGDLFGTSVAIDGDRIVVGAPFDDDAGAESGALYVFDRVGGAWQFAQKLTASGSAAGEVLGTDAAVDGTRVLGGAWAATTPGGSAAGVAYLFEEGPGGAWTEVQRLSQQDTNGGLNFGFACDLEGDEMIIGARGDDLFGFHTGAAYLYSVSGSEGASLAGCPGSISIQTGGSQDLALDAGPAHAGDLFLVLGSLSGTSPGIPVPPFVFPLNLDNYLLFTLGAANTPPLPISFGVLDAQGRANALFQIPPAANIAPGTVAHHAYALFDGQTFQLSFTSNPTPVTFLP